MAIPKFLLDLVDKAQAIDVLSPKKTPDLNSLTQPSLQSAQSTMAFLKPTGVTVGAVAREIPGETVKKAKQGVELFLPAATEFTKTVGNIFGEGFAYALDKNVREQYKKGDLDILPYISKTSQFDLLKKTAGTMIEQAVYRVLPSGIKAAIPTRLGVGALEGIGFAVSEGLAKGSSVEEIITDAKKNAKTFAVFNLVAPYLEKILSSKISEIPKAFKSLPGQAAAEPRFSFGLSLKEVPFSKSSLDAARKAVGASEAVNLERGLAEGSIPREMVFQKGDILQPKFTKGRIDDIAQKLNRYLPDSNLSEQFLESLKVFDLQRLTMKELKSIQKGALKLIDKAEKAQLKKAVPRLENFAKKFPKPAQKPIVEKLVKPQAKEIFEQRRGIISNQELRDLAKGKTEVLDRFGSLPPGSIASGEEVLAARTELAERVLETNLSLKTAVEPLAKGTKGILGVRAELGRGVQQFKVPVEDEVVAKAAEKLIKARDAAVDPIVKAQLQEMISVLSGQTKVPGLWDKIVEWATAIKLTSYRTPFRAGIGNLFSTLFKTPEKLVAGGVIDPLRSLVTRTPREQFAREAVSNLVGQTHGIKEGARAAIKSLMDESFAASQQRGAEAIPVGGAIGGKLGKAIRMPFRFISAPDAFFRAVNTKGEAAALATRQAIKEGLVGEKLAIRIDELLKSRVFEKAAGEEAAGTIFQEELGKFANSVNHIRNQFPPLKLVAAFFKTPVNLLKYGVRRSPLAVGLPSTWKAIIKEGGPAANEAIARMAVGSSVLSGIYLYAKDGSITGNWKHLTAAERDARYRQGTQPNSIKIGNRWYSYRGLEPLSFYLTFASEIAETNKEPTVDRMNKILVSLAEDFANQPFLLGINNVIEALSDPKRNGTKFAADLIKGSVIPVGIGDIARLIDPVVRKTETIGQGLKSVTPGLSKSLNPKRNVWGEPIVREGGLLQRLSPVNFTTEKTSAFEKELERLNIVVGFPQERIGPIQFDAAETNTFEAIAGRLAKKEIIATMKSPDYQQASDEEREDMITGIVRDTREVVRNKMLADVIIKRIHSPDKATRVEFIKETLPALFRNASIERKQIILEAMRR